MSQQPNMYQPQSIQKNEQMIQQFQNKNDHDDASQEQEIDNSYQKQQQSSMKKDYSIIKTNIPTQENQEMFNIQQDFHTQMQLNQSISEDENQVNSILKNLKIRLNSIKNVIFEKENEKQAVIDDINVLTQRLRSLTKSINKKQQMFEVFQKTYEDAESAYHKITDGAKTLLAVIKKENANFNQISQNKQQII